MVAYAPDKEVAFLIQNGVAISPSAQDHSYEEHSRYRDCRYRAFSSNSIALQCVLIKFTHDNEINVF